MLLQPPKGARAVQASGISPRLIPGGSRIFDGVGQRPDPRRIFAPVKKLGAKPAAPREGKGKFRVSEANPGTSEARVARSPTGAG